MKTKVLLICLMVGGLFLASLAGAETFTPKDCLYIDADENGRVFHKGNPVDIAVFTTGEQFCPDQFKASEGGICDVLRNKYQDFRTDNPDMTWFQLNMKSVDERGQVAFNDHAGRPWLLLPNPKVVIRKNLALEMSYPNNSSEGGAHFVYTGHGYVPKYPVSGGGEACREPVVSLEVPTVAEKPKKAVPAKKILAVGPADQVMGGGDSKATVKGDKNDVTPQTVKNQGKIGKTVIRGNNNTVKKKITNIGIAAKTTGDNSSITIHINGLPTVEDETCIKCHTNVVKKTTADKNGNVVTEQKVEQRKETAPETKPGEKKERGIKFPLIRNIPGYKD